MNKEKLENKKASDNPEDPENRIIGTVNADKLFEAYDKIKTYEREREERDKTTQEWKMTKESKMLGIFAEQAKKHQREQLKKQKIQLIRDIETVIKKYLREGEIKAIDILGALEITKLRFYSCKDKEFDYKHQEKINPFWQD